MHTQDMAHQWTTGEALSAWALLVVCFIGGCVILWHAIPVHRRGTVAGVCAVGGTVVLRLAMIVVPMSIAMFLALLMYHWVRR